MCTAVADRGLFGRTLDLEYSYGEEIVITPRSYRFEFSDKTATDKHYAIIGVAHVSSNTPLYYDGINEAGLGAAALNFPEYAVYHPHKRGQYNIASFELIPWILSQCDSVDSAQTLLQNVNITADSFSEELKPTPLHWIIADKTRAIIVESTADGMQIYENQLGVMTNSPSFPFHLAKTAEYMHLDSNPPTNTIAPSIELELYSRGMGAIGLPGDYSSSSRFVRTVFAKNHTTGYENKDRQISRFFHIMDTVSVPKGCVKTDEGKEVYTVYTSCGDLSSGRYFYTTYGCRRIIGVDLHGFDLEDEALYRVKMENHEDILLKK